MSSLTRIYRWFILVSSGSVVIGRHQRFDCWDWGGLYASRASEQASKQASKRASEARRGEQRESKDARSDSGA
ncbi:hypothetical protein BO99DRAFT_400141 [Aspergillus violaceofuscus CBS 115571]|uniref:Uncharacterized protein n=1 Tax=Aspergillus violaceofuscus (strain CBS 115571) TaxID=1450538 RepID=A0A2V5HDA8_ASPV1|nr:hypothetical protein BO99DRAFT_400141 [Aspergillus violaceofuscus CBS 115571]